jgi:uncharacterized paraquat-inducible protein A
MKKYLKPIILVVSLLLFVFAIYFFVFTYVLFGKYISQYDDNTPTLFKMLASIDYQYVALMFLVIALYMLVLDLVTVLMLSTWRKINNPLKNKKRSIRQRLHDLWQNYFKVHVGFILATVFLTIGMTMPSSIMNTFTAVMSISILIRTLVSKNLDNKK